MPKVVDHDARRRELAQAVWRVIRRDGAGNASVRAVAAEAGWSAGALRHYFTSQDELLRFALAMIVERVPERVQAHRRNDALDKRTRARLMLEELMPMDPEREVELLVYLAFADRARVDSTFAEVREQAWRGVRHLCRAAVAEVAALQPPADEMDRLGSERAERSAATLHALVDGLSLQGIYFPDQMAPATARAILTAVLDDIATT